jgi:hypothetical protein
MGLEDQLASNFEFRVMKYMSCTVWFIGSKYVKTILKAMLGFIMCHAMVLLWCGLQDSMLQIP